MQANYFNTGTNNALSYAQKQEIIHMICFLSQRMNKKNPEKYPSCLALLSNIFNVDLSDLSNDEFVTAISPAHVRAFGLLCDDLMWGTHDEIPKPEGITNAKEIKDKIINYFTEEWSPF